MRKILVGAIALTAVTLAPSAQAEYQWGFGNISMNYLDWTKSTTHKSGGSSHKDDFAYIELEGGAGFKGVTLVIARLSSFGVERVF